MKRALLAAATALTATGAFAAPETYELDPSHSQVLFAFDHFGYSTTWNLFSGIEGDVAFDQENPENSSVSVSFPVRSVYTGWEKRFEHWMDEDFFDASEDEMVSFESTQIEVTGDKTAKITGDLTLNGVTKPVVMDTTLNAVVDKHPVRQKPAVGFTATTSFNRSDYNLGKFAPAVSDTLDVQISIEAIKAD